MKKATIVGTNYAGGTNHVREASRGVVTENGKILLCYETKNDQWMIPGGGREDGETGEECCARELAEETGFTVRPSSCVFEIDEYYEDWKYVTRYYLCDRLFLSERHPTAAEAAAGTEPRWLDVSDALDVFSRHADWAETDESRRGLYLREFTALKAIFTDDRR